MVQEDRNGTEDRVATSLENDSDVNFLEPSSDVSTINLEIGLPNDSKQQTECELSVSPTAKEVSGANVIATESLADCGVLACVFLANTITGMNFTAIAVFYPYLVEHFDATTAAVGWCGSIHGFFQAFVSLFASYPIESYGCRLPSTIGSLIFCVGTTLSCFAPNLTTMYLTYGFIAGSGTALYTLSVGIIVHQRFSRNRTLASGIALLGFSFGSAAGSFIANLLLQSYGWRNTFLIIAAINAQRIPVCMLFRTPARFTSRSERPSGRIRGHVQLRRYLKDILDFSTLRHGRFSVFLTASTLLVFCQSAFINHTVNRAVNVGLTRVQGVVAATVTSSANMVSRVVVSFVANIQGVNPLHIFGIGMLSAVLSIVSLCTSPGMIGTMIAHILFGICTGCTTTVTSTTAVHLMGVTSLPKCLAILQFASGFPRLIASPLIGWVFDVTRDYSKAYAIIGCLALVSGSLIVALTFVTSHQRKSVATDNESPS